MEAAAPRANIARAATVSRRNGEQRTDGVTGTRNAVTLVLMSNDPRDGSSTSDASDARSDDPLTGARIPRRWDVKVREHGNRLTIYVGSDEAMATLIADLITGEHIVEVGGDLGVRASMWRWCELVAESRHRADIAAGRVTESDTQAMNPCVISEWTSMQVLAGATGARWSRSRLFGGSHDEDLAVNRAFLAVVWGL